MTDEERRNESYKASLEYFNGDELAANTFIGKYMAMKNNGEYEKTPDDMHHRMAKEYARIEDKFGGEHKLSYDEIYNLFKDFKYIIPGGSVMGNLGNDGVVGSLSNCFVLGQCEDSYASINKYRDYMVELEKRRGGVGIDLSKLRPRNSKVNNAAKTSTGPVSFMHVFSELSKEVAQGGRRGALMISISGNHPDVFTYNKDEEDFLSCKQDLTKITGANISVKFSDEFMKAVENDTDYYLRWPVDEEVIEVPKMEIGETRWFTDGTCIKRVKAKDVWDKFVHCAWNTAEPGIMYEDRHYNLSPDSVYEQYKGVTTNPCLVGDTLIAVADGRGYVSIKELAEIGADVPVYCLDNNGKLVISRMRNPRITGYNMPIYKITLENGHEIKCTGNHKILVNDKGYVEAKDLVPGDSLFLLTKYEANWNDITTFNKTRNKTDYNVLCTSNATTKRFEHRLIYEYYHNGEHPEIIHHSDLNGLNNRPENLIGMTKKEHHDHHGAMMKGENNPIFKIKADEERFKEYSRKMSESTSGLRNGNALQVDNDTIILEGVKLTRELGRMFSKDEWEAYAVEHKLPITFQGKFRSEDLGNSQKEFSIKCAELAGIEYPNVDVRLYKNYLDVKKYDSSAFIQDGHIYVVRKCEACGNDFPVEYTEREKACCSMECAHKLMEMNDDFKKKRADGIQSFWETRSEETRRKQIEAYLEIEKEKAGEKILLKDYEDYCAKHGISHRFKTKTGFNSYNDMVEFAHNYNHKIVNIEIIGNEDVYNGTVDDYHNFFSGKFEEISEYGKRKYLSINQLQCGEVFMGSYDSCRLMHINLPSFVKDDKTFDYELFEKVSYQNMQLCDDLVELELESVQKIIDHIKSTFIEDNRNELELWEKIYETGKSSRRAGCGATGVADAIALMGLKLGTEESYEVIEKIFQTKMLGELKAQINLAKERGTFKGYEFNKEYLCGECENFVKELGLKNYYCGNNEFFENILVLPGVTEELMNKMEKYGRRNVSWSTMAPVGTGAIMTQGTSGIEPVFKVLYKRRKKCMNSSDRVDYVDDTGEKFTEFNVIHTPFKKWVKNKFNVELSENTPFEEAEEYFKQSPWYGCQAEDLTPEQHVRLQSIVQKYTSLSISKTCNLPSTTTEKEISDIYFDGWKHGCKGLTVYRDGCRSGVMVTNDKKNCDCKCNGGTLTHSAPKRPKSLPCDIKRFKNGGDKWIAFIGLYNGQPFEIFTGLSDNVDMPEYVNSCEIIKNKIDKEVYNEDTGKNEIKNVSSYDIIYHDKNGNKRAIFDVGNIFKTEFEGYSRLISGSMRHGMLPEYIVTTLKHCKFKNETINSWKSGVIRALKSYIKVNESSNETCPECGGKIIRENGCIHCSDCGWSKCE